MLKFFYNGIKENGGKLQKASYSIGNFTMESGHSGRAISVYGKHYNDFSDGVQAAFDVRNASDSQSDYFCNDSFVVEPSHALYAQVRAAADIQDARFDARMVARGLKREARAEVEYPETQRVQERVLFSASVAARELLNAPTLTSTIQ